MVEFYVDSCPTHTWNLFDTRSEFVFVHRSAGKMVSDQIDLDDSKGIRKYCHFLRQVTVAKLTFTELAR